MPSMKTLKKKVGAGVKAGQTKAIKGVTYIATKTKAGLRWMRAKGTEGGAKAKIGKRKMATSKVGKAARKVKLAVAKTKVGKLARKGKFAVGKGLEKAAKAVGGKGKGKGKAIGKVLKGAAKGVRKHGGKGLIAAGVVATATAAYKLKKKKKKT